MILNAVIIYGTTGVIAAKTLSDAKIDNGSEPFLSNCALFICYNSYSFPPLHRITCSIVSASWQKNENELLVQLLRVEWLWTRAGQRWSEMAL